MQTQYPGLSTLFPTSCCRVLNICTSVTCSHSLYVRFSLSTVWDLLCQKGLLTPAGKNASVKSKEDAESTAEMRWGLCHTVLHSSSLSLNAQILLKAN